MSEWLPVLFFIAFLFITIIPILVAGLVHYRVEQVPAPATQADPLATHLPTPRFFAASVRDLAASPARGLEAMIVAGIRTHLQREQELTAEFVAAPSFATLHRRPRRAVREADVGRFLAQELVLADAFVSAPSIESLLRHSNGHAVFN